MGHYSDKSSSVRVDFFKASGKWYCTEAVEWTGEYRQAQLHYEFAKSLHDHLYVLEDDRADVAIAYRLSGMMAVCLEPYHEHEHPIILHVDAIDETLTQRAEANSR
jgi:hypothetical protein